MPFLTADTTADYDAELPADEATSETELVVLGVGDTASVVVLDTKNGEVLDIEDAPSRVADAREIMDWLGPRLTAAQADLEGLVKTKGYWIDKINAQYDPDIKRRQSYVAYLKCEWVERLREYSADLLQNVKSRRSVKVGLVMLQFRAKPARRVVTDEKTALDYLSRVHPDAVKVSHSVLVSRIPDDLMENLPPDCGLQWIPPHDEFEVR